MMWSVSLKELYVEGQFKLDIYIFLVQYIVKTDHNEHAV